MQIIPWQEARNNLEIHQAGYKVFSVSLDQENSSHFSDLLSDAERARSSRLQSKQIADKQIISRGILRVLLGYYLDVKPESLVFSISKYGKPYLSNPDVSQCSFNVSHSGNLTLFAIGGGNQIGIDVEMIEETTDIKVISQLVFSPEELATLKLSKNLTRDFYLLWTSKEAILKATGWGFSYPSNKFSVVLTKGTPTFSKIPAELSGGLNCTLTSFSPIPGYLAATALLQ
jgi:4'-phosphopantetheinyl transferase